MSTASSERPFILDRHLIVPAAQYGCAGGVAGGGGESADQDQQDREDGVRLLLPRRGGVAGPVPAARRPLPAPGAAGAHRAQPRGEPLMVTW